MLSTRIPAGFPGTDWGPRPPIKRAPRNCLPDGCALAHARGQISGDILRTPGARFAPFGFGGVFGGCPPKTSPPAPAPRVPRPPARRLQRGGLVPRVPPSHGECIARAFARCNGPLRSPRAHILPPIAPRGGGGSIAWALAMGDAPILQCAKGSVGTLGPGRAQNNLLPPGCARGQKLALAPFWGGLRQTPPNAGPPNWHRFGGPLHAEAPHSGPSNLSTKGRKLAWPR